MEWTGERYLPTLPDPDISYEHWHRYLHASAFVAGKDVLDVASGEGFGSHLLAQSARRVVGVDRCAEAIRHASAQYARSNLEFLQGDAAAIPVPGEHLFDVVVSFETIEHLDLEGQGQFLSEVKRLLRPEGVFLVSTPNKVLYSDRPSFQNQFHLREFQLPEFREFLARYFRHSNYLGQKVYPISYLWPLDGSAGPIREYQIGYANGCYGPMANEAREVLYVLAICSDSRLQRPGGSLALDVTGQAIYQRVAQAEEKEHQTQTLTAALSHSRAQAEEKDQANQGLTAALGQARAELEEKEQRNQVLTASVDQTRGQVEENGREVQTLRAALERSQNELKKKEDQLHILIGTLGQGREREQALGDAAIRSRQQAEALSKQLAQITRCRSWQVAQFLRKARSAATLSSVFRKRVGSPRRPAAELLLERAEPSGIPPVHPVQTSPTHIEATPEISPTAPSADGEAETLSLVRTAAASHAVTPAVHAKDFIFKFVLTQGGMTLPDAVNYYFDDGARSARKLAELVATIVPFGNRPLKLLEFASGFGCVTRHLHKHSEFELVSCDIHPEAIDFLTSQVGAIAIPSTLSPDQFVAPDQFDVVFALSFFSHMPKASFGRWLKSLYGALKAPGYLIFTTHGMASRKFMGNPDIPPDGFWFSASSEQEDLDGADYGLAITTPEFVREEIQRQIGAAKVDSRLAYWWEHQDLWVVHRERDEGPRAGKS